MQKQTFLFSGAGSPRDKDPWQRRNEACGNTDDRVGIRDQKAGSKDKRTSIWAPDF